VRRISVRATEVETFTRASLIVPNSELITGRVLNWTHRDSLGGASVRVGVAYDADPEQVLGILRACAKQHLEVLSIPEPSAILESFGDSALVFVLSFTVAGPRQDRRVQSDLRVAIFKALRAANIEIPSTRSMSTCATWTASTATSPISWRGGLPPSHVPTPPRATASAPAARKTEHTCHPGARFGAQPGPRAARVVRFRIAMQASLPE
jgi:hypothetical protein